MSFETDREGGELVKVTQIAELSYPHIKPATMTLDEKMKPVRVQSVKKLTVVLSGCRTV